jgi:16S rRNA G966 N2-methylase RsmD
MMNLSEEHKRLVKLYAFTSGATSPTPRPLAEEMVSKLDDEIIKNPNSKFLDPAAGTGTFGVLFYERLLKYHSSDWIMNNMIFMVDVSSLNCDVLRKLGFVNVYNEDFLNWETKMKFDVIVGNPPYQSGKGESGGRSSLWRYFVSKSFSLLNNKGVLSFICPQFPNDSNDIGHIFTNNQTLWVDTGVKKYFNVGSDFVCWAVQKKPNTDKTYFSNENMYLKITNEFIPNIVSDITISIISKIKSKPQLEIIYSDGVNHNKLKETTNTQSPVKSKLHKYKLRRTSNDTMYSYTSILPTYYDVPKITFTKSGNPNFKFHNGIDDKVGTIKHLSGGIVCDSLEIAHNMIYVFSETKLSKLYKILISNGGMTGFNFIRPVLDYRNKLTDLDIYNYYGLTQEEIDYVESYFN